MPRSDLVRLYPTGLAFIDNVPAVVCDVTPDRARELLAYQPPAFTAGAPKEPPAASDGESKEMTSNG